METRICEKCGASLQGEASGIAEHLRACAGTGNPSLDERRAIETQLADNAARLAQLSESNAALGAEIQRVTDENAGLRREIALLEKDNAALAAKLAAPQPAIPAPQPAIPAPTAPGPEQSET